MRRLAARLTGGARFTRRGWTLVGVGPVLLFAAYVGGRPLLLTAACFVLAVPLAAWIVVRASRPRLATARAFAPNVIEAGSTTTATVTVRNLAPSRFSRAVWSDALPWHPWTTPVAELPALQPRLARFVGRGNAATVQYDLRPPRRGVFAIGPMSVLVHDAFGLVTSETVVGDRQTLVVTPEVVPLGDTGLSVPAGDGESRLVQRRATGDDDDSMTREYRSGDAMRRVHWRASARHGDLMVRQEEQRSFPEARIIVETSRAAYRDASTDPIDDVESSAFEWTVRMLASVSVHLRRAGFLVTIDETGPAQLEAFGHGRRRTWGDEEFLARLATLTLSDAPAARHPGRERGANGPLIALLGHSEPDTIDWLLAQRRPGELAVAFMVRTPTAVDVISREFGFTSTGPSTGERLADAGWLVVPVRSDDDHASAWDAVVIETGRARGTA